MRGEVRSRARFGDVAPSAGHYESFYLKATHPLEPLSVWVRYTVHKRPGAAPTGSLWFTLFDRHKGGPRAVKETLDEVGSRAGELIHVGESSFMAGQAVGSAAAQGRSAAWELAFEGAEEPFFHLPSAFMYRAPVPRTKLLSPYPDVRFSGRVEIDGRALELDDWRGMVGHNWGAQHAERWIWMHAAGFEGSPDAWLDAALGKIRLGPLTTPWIANGVLSLGGARHRLGGPARTRQTEVDERPTRCDFTLPGNDITVQGTVEADAADFVGWVYADPDGSEHQTVNCSASDMTLVVSQPGGEPLTLRCAAGAAYELGMREHDHGMAIQPFRDG